MKTSRAKRRDFLKTSAIGAGLVVLPSGLRAGPNTPSNKLNIGLIGAAGRARAHYSAVEKENVVALCDVDSNNMAKGAQKFPKAKNYEDWRVCLDQSDLDAIVCCTTDHTHAFVANWALNRDLHVFCEKPLANTVEEARAVRANYLKRKDKLATQCGTQRHAFPNFNRLRELVHDGAIGTLSDVYTWGNRQLPRPGYLPAQGDPPSTLNYDLWLGPSPFHPYNPGYFGGCLKWNMYWDFGSGQVGDMGSHTMDLAWNVVDAEWPTAIVAEGEPYNPDVSPVELTATFDHPANDWRPAIKVSWHQGGSMPRSPRNWVDLNKIGHGAMFKGDKGFIICDFNQRLLIPQGDTADMSYYNRRPEEEMLPDVGHFTEQWTNACKGDLKTACDFDYSGTLIEQMLLGLVAYRVGKKIKYDGKAGRVIGNPEADALLSKKYRDGWVLDG